MQITFDVPVVTLEGDEVVVDVYGALYGTHYPATASEPECRKEFDLEYYEPQNTTIDTVAVSTAAEAYVSDNYNELLGHATEEDAGFYYE